MSPCCAVVQPCFQELAVAVPGHLGEVAVGLRLLEVGAQLRQCAFRLRDLVLDLRRGDLDEKIASLHPATDVDIALGDVAAGACIDIGLLEGFRGAGPARDAELIAGAHRRGAHRRHEVAPRLCGRHHLGVQREVLPEAIAEGTGEKRDDQEGQDGAASVAFRLRGHLHGLVIDRVFVHRDAVVRERGELVHTGSSANAPCAGCRHCPCAAARKGRVPTKRVVGVANSSPPITARASAAFCSSPGPPIAIGIMPTIIAVAVISTGRMRVRPEAIAASNAV